MLKGCNMIYIILLIIGYMVLYFLSVSCAFKLADLDNPNSSLYCHKREDIKDDLLSLFCIINIIPFGSIIFVLLNQLLFETE
jgi:hypothetical protein